MKRAVNGQLYITFELQAAFRLPRQRARALKGLNFALYWHQMWPG